jgi:hypothetical protein
MSINGPFQSSERIAFERSWSRASTQRKQVLAVGATAALSGALFSFWASHWALGALLGMLSIWSVAQLYLARAVVTINRVRVSSYEPLRGHFQIAWDEIRYVLTDRTTYAFVGSDKALTVVLGDRSPECEGIRLAINDLTRARCLPVMQMRERPATRSHNTRMSR